MRPLFRLFLTGAMALYITTRLIPGFIIEGSLLDFAIVAACFTIVQMIVKPLINFLLLPFHFVTLGTVSWIVNLLALYGLTFFIAKVKIVGFTFEGLATGIVVIPSMEITSFMTAILTSLSLGLIGAILHWSME